MAQHYLCSDKSPPRKYWAQVFPSWVSLWILAGLATTRFIVSEILPICRGIFPTGVSKLWLPSAREVLALCYRQCLEERRACSY